MTDTSASWIWLNGRLAHAQVPHLSAYDRGFQLGDAVFEALRARRGVAVELDGHLNRLRASLQALAIALPYSDVDLAAAIEQLLAADGLDGLDPAGDAAVRLTVSRGTDYARGVSPNPGGEPSVVIQAWPHAEPSDCSGGRREAERLITSTIRRVADSPISGIKTTSRVELVYARLEAERAGADDAIFLTTDGRITEATTSNVLLIRGNVCATPLPGDGAAGGHDAGLAGRATATP
jgi:branched-chain amino acid aminotransferase